MTSDLAARPPRTGPGRVLGRTTLAVALLALALALAPPASAATPSTIAAAGDIACSPRNSAYNDGRGEPGACRQKATSDLLVAGGYTAVLALGDTQYERGSYPQYQTVYDPTWGRVKATTYPAVGNHEYLTKGAAGYYRYFGAVGAGVNGDGYYSFDVGEWHIVSLNSTCWIVACGWGSPQQRWLRTDLSANPTACTLAFFHHPLFSSGTHGDNTFLKPLWWTLYKARVDIVLNGHDHDYERFAPMNPKGQVERARGIREFVVGTGGKSHFAFSHREPHSLARNDKTFGILALTLRSASYAWEFIPAGKTYTDSGSARCH